MSRSKPCRICGERLSCNQGLGKFRDDPGLLDTAARCLREGVTRGVTAQR